MTTTLRILSIETSCDETALAVVEYDPKTKTYTILVEALNSQIDIHKEFGGVFPTVAKREHGNNLTSLLYTCLEKLADFSNTPIDLKNINLDFLTREQELKEILKNELEKEDSFIKHIPDIDYIAVTRGPGLEPALWVGLSFAKFLATLWQKPLLPINHMEGHISSILARESEIAFPSLALLISGGHTEVVDISKWGDYSVIGKTRDDAVGEAYDKVARILGMEYPGGPMIASRSEKVRGQISVGEIQQKKDSIGIKLPRPMLHSHNLDLSFSGLKTAVLYLVRDFKKAQSIEALPEETIDLICHEFEDAVAEVLVSKLTFAYREHSQKYKNLIVAGGVIANDFLKERIQSWCDDTGIHFLKPDKGLATDNAVMIGLAALVGLNHGYVKILKCNNTEFIELKPDGDWSLNTI